MSVQASRERDGAILPIVAPGVSRGKGDLINPGVTFTSQPIDGNAVYIFCSSLVHVAEGNTVSDLDAPIDARSGIYLNANIGKTLSFKLVGSEDPATVWVHEVR